MIYEEEKMNEMRYVFLNSSFLACCAESLNLKESVRGMCFVARFFCTFATPKCFIHIIFKD